MPAACGPMFCKTKKSSGLTSRAGSSTRRLRSSRPVNTTARPSDSNSAGVAAARLKMAPSGARLPLSATSPPTGDTGSSKGRITARSTQAPSSSSRSPKQQFAEALVGFRGVGSASCDQGGDECAKQGFAATACVVHDLEEPEIERQLLLRETPVRAEPGPQQGPEPLDG